jgi:hypothetical protein
MDRFAEKQNQISQHRAEAHAHYPAIWSRMVAEWNSPGPEDRAWLMYSANYLVRTNNIRWAIDPLTLNWMLNSTPAGNAAQDLSSLSFVLLTHCHKDHLDMDLLSELRHLPIRWVIPEILLPLVTGRVGLQRENMIIACPLEPIELCSLSILPFDGLHWETLPDGTRKGVPATGYLIESEGRRWLFPGDTRTYEAFRLPDLGSVEHLFAHLWLGRGFALMEDPPLINIFCKFCLDLKPRRITLTHLYEFGRDANDYWDDRHAHLVCSKFREMSESLPVAHLIMGNSVLL